MKSKAALISIHPQHVENILTGRKVFEYRKRAFKPDITHVVIYSTSPVQEIVAVAELDGYIDGAPTTVWKQTAYGSGITRQYFRDYYQGRKKAYALRLGRVFRLKKILRISNLKSRKSAPQSFSYLRSNDWQMVKTLLPKKPHIPTQIIFIGGIHGVGKSTLCNSALAPAVYKCVTASSLIKDHGRRVHSNKQVTDVKSNQEALLAEFKLSRNKHPLLAMDGHFTLVTAFDNIEPISIDVFRRMGLKRLILVKGHTNVIASRLHLRDGKKWNKAFLQKFQKSEEIHAFKIAESLNIPLDIITNEMRPRDLAKLLMS